MSGPQFIHIETYARRVSSLRREREAGRAEEGKAIDRKLSVEEICGEAARSPGHHPHVEQASPPRILFGVSPETVPSILEERIAVANRARKAKRAEMARGTRATGPRAVRADTHVLLAGVSSYPEPWIDPATGLKLMDDPEKRALFDRWSELDLAWQIKTAARLGIEILSVVEHEDEPYPHRHLLGVTLDDRGDVRGCHPGYIAKDALCREKDESDKDFKKRQNAAYQHAMRDFQDSYFDEVSIEAGLLRFGPKRFRKPRAVWQIEKADASSRAKAKIYSEQLHQHTERVRVDLSEAEGMLASTSDEAVEAIVLASDLERRRALLDSEIADKEGRGRQLDALLQRGDQALAEGAHRYSELAEERERLEADLMSIQMDVAKRIAEFEDTLRSQREELNQIESDHKQKLASDRSDYEAEKREWIANAKHKEAQIEEQAAIAAATRNESEALIAGIEAYVDGRLKFRPEDKEQPFSIVAGAGAIELRNRLMPVKARLREVVVRLDERLTDQARRCTAAVAKAVDGWFAGDVAIGNSIGSAGGLVLSDAMRKAAGHLFEPFERAIVAVLSVLPTRSAIEKLRSDMMRSAEFLNARERQQSQQALEAVERSMRITGDENSR